MYGYSFFQWVMFFYIYCFVGWCIESTIVSIENKKPVNRGFLRGPYLPIYGFGAVFVLMISLPLKDNPVLVYFCSMIGCTILEYFTGWAMEKTLKMKYWDYSDMKFNFHGRICLTTSLFWGFLAIFLTYVLHDAVEYIVLAMSIPALYFSGGFITCLVVSDLVYAIKTALDMNKILAKISQVREDISEARRELSEKISSNERVIQLNEKIEKLKAFSDQKEKSLGFFKRDYINAHPTAKFSNVKLNEAWKEVKEKIEETRKSKKS